MLLFWLYRAKTLSILQSLYDNKLTTYPRVESFYLTSDMVDVIHERAAIGSTFFACREHHFDDPKTSGKRQSIRRALCYRANGYRHKAHIDELFQK